MTWSVSLYGAQRGNTMNNINNFEDLFVNILSVSATTEAAMSALRETIFWEIVNNTANRHRTTEQDFAVMRKTAESAVNANEAKFYVNDRLACTYRFSEGDDETRLNTLRKFYREVVLQAEAWYGDRDGQGDGTDGFCWKCHDSHYRVIWK